ncbi:MAG: acetolactate synthase large subunit [Candidatus Acidiferrales bacterium]
MNGAESLVRTLIAGGVEVCFTNPGTSEMHIVAALDRAPQMRCVLALFEGVVSGAADGYARMTEKPACTLVHLGPGFANSVANLHNATRARVPIVNLVGEHPAEHRKLDAPLTSDIEAIARPYSKWLRTSRTSTQAGRDAADAIVAARTPPGQIATLIVPADVAWGDGGTGAPAPKMPSAAMPAQTSIDRVAAMLKSGNKTALLLGGNSAYGRGLMTAGRIAAATGATLIVPYPCTRLERGAGIVAVERVPYVLEQAQEFLKDFRHLILVGTDAPVAYFAYPGKSPEMAPPSCEIHRLTTANEDHVGALEAVVTELNAGAMQVEGAKADRPALPTGPITHQGIAAAVAALLPENAIVSDESMTSGRGLMAATRGAPRHDWLCNTGGSIGTAIPHAVGAAVACPDRQVLCLSADGSGMYTLQGLWTIARENLKVTTVIFANHAYAVLKREFAGLGVGEPGARAQKLFSIGQPELEWVALAKGMGVPGQRVTSLEEFTTALRAGIESGGPSLIEVPL